MPAGAPLSGIGRVWLLGCGNMGGALLSRWVAAGLSNVAVIDPEPRNLPPRVPASSGPNGAPPDVLVVAVKPQALADAATPLLPHLKPETVIVSIAAGVGCAALSALFEGREVVRTMPNTPARIGQGVTALYAPQPGGRTVAAVLMNAAGACVWLENEGQFDAVTAVSGSGPAYVFAFVEALSAAGVAAGLPEELAAELALRTVGGAARLAMTGEDSPADLRIAVTSPGGTTMAGLDVLVPRLGPLLAATVAAAQSRSRELGEVAGTTP